MEPRKDEDHLVAELRSLRRTPHPEFAAELDKRAAAGFPRRSRLPRFSLGRLGTMPPKRLLIPAGGLAIVAIAALSAVLVTNEGGSNAGSADTLGFLNKLEPDSQPDSPSYSP